jgi:hypothetical protein
MQTSVVSRYPALASIDDFVLLFLPPCGPHLTLLPTGSLESGLLVGVLDRHLPRGVPEVDECGLSKIGNSKEETRGTQFRQVRATRCVIPYVLYAAYLWIDWV